MIRTSLLALGAAGLLLAGCNEASSPAAASTPTLQAALQSGIYVNGTQGTPHYFVTVTSKPDATFTGTVSFLAQDGQTNAAFTFTATTQSGVATLTTSTGRIITGTFSSQGFNLGSCKDYLTYVQSLSQCTFTFSPGGIAG